MDIGQAIILVTVTAFYFGFALQLKPPFPAKFYTLYNLRQTEEKALFKKTQNTLFRGFLYILVILLLVYTGLISFAGGN